MLAKCKKDSSHKRFFTTAHVVEEWEVDEHGEWISTVEQLDVSHWPDSGNEWTCAECGSVAEVEAGRS